jgi:hypothetical protein
MANQPPKQEHHKDTKITKKQEGYDRTVFPILPLCSLCLCGELLNALPTQSAVDISPRSSDGPA